jgi:hypothetical protein
MLLGAASFFIWGGAGGDKRLRLPYLAASSVNYRIPQGVEDLHSLMGLHGPAEKVT